MLLLQIFGHMLLVVNTASLSPNNKTINIGYLQDLHRIIINVAIEEAQADGLLPEYNFR